MVRGKLTGPLGRAKGWFGHYKQPFGSALFPGIWPAHPRYTSRTVLVKENDVDSAFQLLNKLMEKEGLLKIIRCSTRFIKPTKQRHMLSVEISKAILDEDMSKKMRFLLRKNRMDAYPGQMTQ